MIYEVCTATLKPGARAEAYGMLGFDDRLFGCWHSEIGELNQLVIAWQYRDLTEWASERRTVDLAPLLHDEETELWHGEPFPAGSYGAVYEMRTYTFHPGAMPRVLDIWAESVPERIRLSPLVALWHNAVGRRNRLRHIWAYDSLDARGRIREKALELPLWPPMTREWRTHEVSQILLPAPFSPLH
jgi:hypothetical protein